MNLAKQAFAIIFLSLTNLALAQGPADQALIAALDDFATAHTSLEIPTFDYSYKTNFARIQNLQGIDRQVNFYQDFRRRLQNLPRERINPSLHYLYDTLVYELFFNLERLDLEQSYRSITPAPPLPERFSDLPNHERWYALYARRWSSRPVTVDELIALGAKQVANAQAHTNALQRSLGYANDDDGFYQHLQRADFYFTDLSDAIASYRQKQQTVQSHLPDLFFYADIPPVDIKPAPGGNATTPPGFYEDGMFYFNFYGNRHSKRAMDWLFMHEAIPGHHYHARTTAANPNPSPSFRKLVNYPGHAEGWGAYVEHLGGELGLYQNDYDRFGKWEWDLVRSARVVMDVGINALGWSREDARAYWKRKIKFQDAIMDREITRMFNWPGQVLSYKVGEEKILALRQRFLAANKRGTLKAFHHLLVSKGRLPLPVLEEMVETMHEEAPLLSRTSAP